MSLSNIPKGCSIAEEEKFSNKKKKMTTFTRISPIIYPDEDNLDEDDEDKACKTMKE